MFMHIIIYHIVHIFACNIHPSQDLHEHLERLGVDPRFYGLRWLTLLPALACVGFAASVWQAQRLGDHLLAEPVYGAAVTGTVHSILWRPDGPRFILSDLTSNHPALSPTLRSVQVKWRGNRPDSEAAGKQPRDMLGQRLEWNLTLLPVRESLMPGGFDFRRQAFFKGLSAYAYSLDAPTVLSAGQRSRTESWRQILRARFMKRLDGDAGRAGFGSLLRRAAAPQPADSCRSASHLK